MEKPVKEERSIEEHIEEKIAESEKIRALIRQRIEDSAMATSAYDRAIAVTMIRLGAGEVLQIEDGDKTYATGKVIASNMDKLARGICWSERLAMETAEGLLKSALKNLESVGNEMTAWQSIAKSTKG